MRTTGERRTACDAADGARSRVTRERPRDLAHAKGNQLGRERPFATTRRADTATGMRVRAAIPAFGRPAWALRRRAGGHRLARQPAPGRFHQIAPHSAMPTPYSSQVGPVAYE
jgi:hypothetical protein